MTSPLVLLVDDEPAVVNGLSLRLRSPRFRVVTANSAAQALKIISEQQVSLIVSDERMPNMPGSEFLTLVAKSHPDIIRIILTGQASIEAAMQAINGAKVAHYLTKPCDTAQLKALIEKFLDEQEEPPAPAEPSDRAIALLESLHPGIGEVRRDTSGAILLDDEDDVAA